MNNSPAVLMPIAGSNALPLLPPGTLRSVVLALVAYVIMTMIITWPLPVRLCSAVPGDLADAMTYPAILHWDWSRMTALAWGDYFQAPFVFPYSYGLAYASHQTGLAIMGLPLFMLGVEPLPVYNLLTLAAFPLAALAMFLLAFKLTHSRGGAFLAGIVYAFAPFRLLRLGHFEVLHSWGIPLALLLLIGLLERPRPVGAAVLALVCVWQSLTNLYFMVYLAMILPLSLLFLAPRYPAHRTMRLWLLLLLVVLTTLIALLPFMLPYRVLQQEMGFTRSLAEVFAPQSWRNYFGVPAINIVWGRCLGKFDMTEGALFPGVLALLLAGGGLLTRPYYPGARGLALLLLVVAVLLSAGSLSRLAAVDTGVLYRILYNWFPGFSGLRVATRWQTVTLLALGLLVANGWTAWRRRMRKRTVAVTVLAALACGIGVESYQPPLLRSFPVSLQRPAIIARLRDLPPGAVIQLPLEWFQNLAMYHGITHGKPIVQAGTSQTVFLLDTLLGLDPRSAESITLLESIGVRYIIVRTDADTTGAWRIACATDSRLRQLDADEYGVLFELTGRGGCYLALPAALSDLAGQRLPDGSAVVSLALPGNSGRPVISLQRFFAGELTLLAGGQVLRRQTVRFELPPFATGTQRTAAIVADMAAADELQLTLDGRKLRGVMR